MMKTNLIIFVCIFLVSCASKQEAQQMNIGITLTDSAIDYALQGQARMAEFAYSKAIEKFRDMGRFCDMSRVALLMDSASANISFNTLEDARAFALLGACKEELNIVSFLEGHPYVLKALEEPYKSYAEAIVEDSISPLKSVASSSNDRVKTDAYRKIALMLMKKNLTADALVYIEDAIVIDGRHAWTSNLLDDEIIKKNILEKEGKPLDVVNQRIDILRKAIDAKF